MLAVTTELDPLLRRIAQLGTDSKARRLKVELDACLADGFDSMIVFTQYTDTMEYLRVVPERFAGVRVFQKPFESLEVVEYVGLLWRR